MMGFLVSLHVRAKTLLHHLKATNLVHGTKKAKPLSSSLTKLWWSTADFAAMGECNQFKRVFEVIDADADGKISPSDLTHLLLCLGHDDKSAAETEAQGMVREMDSDGDGLVGLDEFMNAVFGGGVAGEDSDGVDLMDAFLVFDADKNGKISAEELRRVLVKLGGDKCSIEECRRMIKGVDRDGDGFVDFQEFRLMMMTKNR